jgi:hypothetical protein
LSVTVSESHDEPAPQQHPHSRGRSPLGGDPQKLREALIAFLNRDQADWDALSRDLAALAASSNEGMASRIEPLLQPTPRTAGAQQPPSSHRAEPIDPEEVRDAWLDFAQQITRSRARRRKK